MSTFRIDDEHGNELCVGLLGHRVREVAQRKANAMRRPVYVSEDVEDGEDEAEEIEPEPLT